MEKRPTESAFLLDDAFSINTPQLVDERVTTPPGLCPSLAAVCARRPPVLVVLLALVFVQLAWAGYSIMVQALAVSTNPLVFSCYRDALVFPVLFGVSGLLEGWRAPFSHPIETLLFFALGAFLCLSQLFFMEGTFLSNADYASILTPTVALWTPLLSMGTCTEPLLRLRTPAGWMRLLGLLLGLLGAVTILAASWSLGPPPAAAPHLTLGILCLLGNAVSMAVYITLQRRFIFGPTASAPLLWEWRRFPIAATAWAYFFAALGSFFAAIYVMVTDPAAFVLNATQGGVLVYAILISSP
jgi:drug/metabolite transporter (DMT)-like permease